MILVLTGPALAQVGVQESALLEEACLWPHPNLDDTCHYGMLLGSETDAFAFDTRSAGCNSALGEFWIEVSYVPHVDTLLLEASSPDFYRGTTLATGSDGVARVHFQTYTPCTLVHVQVSGLEIAAATAYQVDFDCALSCAN